ncbi:cyclase [Lysobacter sp. TY2-98]|uniref:cyclase n=1 Tax=Lysobacter sp. TY2-98 TaxID=2290922 RepID=UPI000E1FB813|nr:cyclase [Lysobacter sp. TY2-98]AXK72455.1 cyclase [Lysobacter sp. TY2-98]
MSNAQHRAVFDFEIAFSNGGGLCGWDFRLDIPGDAIHESWLAERIVEDMRLLMVGSVVLSNVRVVAEAHRRVASAA